MDEIKSQFNTLAIPAGTSQSAPPSPSRVNMAHTENSFLSIIEGISSPSEQNSGRFDFGIVSQADDNGLETRQYDEKDFQSHRRENFQTHHTLKPRNRIKRKSTTYYASGKSDSKDGFTRSTTPADVRGTRSAGQIVEEEEDTESSPLLRSSATTPGKIISPQSEYADLIHLDKKVMFEVGGSPLKQALDDEKPETKKIRVKSQKYEDPNSRLRQGSQLNSSNIPPLLPGFEANDMAEVDKDDLSSHRFQNNRGYRRHKFYLNDDSIPPNSSKFKLPKYDHDPHEVFVELDILRKESHSEEKEWSETARWIKYEEDIEEGTNRWGKPHVASLSFHALINLRRLIETGVLLLDLEEKDLPSIAYRVVEQMGMEDLIFAEEKGVVLSNLLLKHKHIHPGSNIWKFGLRRNTASLANLSALDDKGKNQKAHSSSAANFDLGILNRANSTATKLNQDYQDHLPLHRQSATRKERGGSPTRESTHVVVDLSKLSPSGLSEEDVRWIAGNEHILRRIPAGSELALVLVGVDDTLQNYCVAFVRLAESVYMANVTEVPIPVRFIFVLLGPSSDDLDYKEIGRSISTLMSNPQFHNIAYKATERKHLLRGIHEFLDSSIVIPPGDWNWDDDCFPFQDLMEKSRQIQKRKLRKSVIGDTADNIPSSFPERKYTIDPFKRTKKLFGGFINDIRGRFPLYLSDIKDGLNSQCLATIIFLYFAAVSGAIAFGGLMEIKTEKFIGISETLIGTCIGGVLVALLGGQPLLIVGSTGTTLVFDESLYKFCKSQDLTGNDFLAIRTWIGIWLVIIGLIVVAFEGSCIVKYFSRFTQEIYATLISFVFIYESFVSLNKVFRSHRIMRNYENCVSNTDNSSYSNANDTTYQNCDDVSRPNVALLSLILMLGTFLIAYSFKQFRNTSFFNTAVRKTIANFAVLIAIVFMGLVDFVLKDTQTDKLMLPSISGGLNPSNKERPSWLIDPVQELPIGWIFGSAIPALLLFILIFMETSIAELIIGKKEYRLLKGSGFHLDVVLMCFVNLIMGYLGTCWISAASVRCVTHTVALTVYSTNDPPGQKASIIGVKEQRVTSFSVSLLIGLSILMASVLIFIPMAVLFGVFLFMGVSSMTGVQFLERVSLFFKQPNNHPQVPYVRRVRTMKMHLFTIIQILCLGFLWAIKESPAALSLPLIIFLLVPFRFLIIPYWFKSLELAALDAEGLEICEPPKEKVALVEVPDSEIYGRIEKFESPQISYANGKTNLIT